MSAASQQRQSQDKPDRVPLGFGGLQARVSDHIGHFFRSTDEWKSVLVPFLKAGLDGGDLCIYVTSPEAHAVADITAALAAEGIDVDRCRTTGQLILTEGTYDLRVDDTRTASKPVWLSDVPVRAGSRTQRSVVIPP